MTTRSSKPYSRRLRKSSVAWSRRTMSKRTRLPGNHRRSGSHLLVYGDLWAFLQHASRSRTMVTGGTRTMTSKTRTSSQKHGRFVRRIVPEIRKVHQFTVTKMERSVADCRRRLSVATELTGRRVRHDSGALTASTRQIQPPSSGAARVLPMSPYESQTDPRQNRCRLFRST